MRRLNKLKHEVANFELTEDINLEGIKEIAGGDIHVVGGAVRDTLLGEEINDLDFCVTGVTPEQFSEIYPRAKLVGKDFPVFLMGGNEFALARKERSTGNSYKDFEVTCSDDISIQEDLIRRDLTINSLAFNIHTNELIDPMNGLNDLAEGIIKSNDNSFIEDPLRIYRMARFVAQYGFSVHTKTRTQVARNRNRIDLRTLSTERIFEELRKVLKTENPRGFFDELANLGFNYPFKEIFDLMGVPQPKEHHPEGDAFEHTMQSVNLMSKLTDEEHVIFGALMHDIGKGLTDTEDYPHHYLHAQLGLDALDSFIERMPVPNAWEQAAEIFIREHMRAALWEHMRPSKVVRLFNRIDRSRLHIVDLMTMVYVDRKARLSYDAKLPEVDVKINEVAELYENMYEETSGDDIDQERYSGPEIGQQLFQLRCHWLKQNRKELLEVA